MKAILNELLNQVTKKGVFRELLWTNPSTSSFSGQTVSLDLTAYDEIEITPFGGTYSTDAFPVTRVEVGKATHLIGGWHADGSSVFFFRFRPVQVYSDGVAFGNANYCYNDGGNAVDNSSVIPYKIYGIRYLGG